MAPSCVSAPASQSRNINSRDFLVMLQLYITCIINAYANLIPVSKSAPPTTRVGEAVWLSREWIGNYEDVDHTVLELLSELLTVSDIYNSGSAAGTHPDIRRRDCGWKVIERCFGP